MKLFDLFYHTVNTPFDYAKTWKAETGKKVVGHFCSYTPEEIIHSADALSFRIFGSDDNLFLADAHLQPYSCSLVRGALGDALAGKLDFLNGIVFPHTCDSIQRLSDIWRLNIGQGFHLDMVLPVKLHTDSARAYMAGVFRKFKQDLERALDIEITNKDLKAAAETINNVRACLKKLYELRCENPSIVSSGDILKIVKGSMMMDRNVLVEKLAEIIENLEKKTADTTSNKKRLVLTGGICSMPDIFEIIEDSGGAVVWDDLCTGSRYFEAETDLEGDIIESLARRYLERIVCPAKHSGLFSRGKHIVNVAKERRADGVIFLFLKFCDPHLFDYPYINEMLEKEGLPSMVFEIENRLPSKEQFKTRCEAFMEML